MLGVLAFAGMFASIPTVTLAPGTNLPMVSLGTGSGQKGDVANATETWIRVGGVAIDTAYIYDDESDIAAGISRAGIGASDLFITTKIPCTDYAQAKKNIATNLAQLKASSGEPPFSASRVTGAARIASNALGRWRLQICCSYTPQSVPRWDRSNRLGRQSRSDSIAATSVYVDHACMWRPPINLCTA
jgi:hypothetical protein